MQLKKRIKIIFIAILAIFIYNCSLPKKEKSQKENLINKAETLIKEGRYISAYNILKKNKNKLKMKSNYWLLLGNTALKIGNIEEAIEYYRKAISIEKDESNKEKLQTKLAYLYLILNYFENANLIAKKILEKDPNNLYANLILGRIDILKGKKESVKKKIKKIEKNGKISCEKRIEIGDLYLLIKNYQKALENYEEAKKSCPNKIDPLLALSNFFFLKKDYKSSEKYIKEAISIAEKRNLKQLTDKLKSFLAEFYIKTNQTEKAEKIYKLLHEKEQKNQFYTLRLIEIYLQEKKLEKAENLIKEISKSKTFFTYYLLGHLNLLKGNYKEATLYFSQALSKEKNSRAYYYLALSQWLTGLERQAIINLEKSITLDPTFIQGKLLLSCLLLKNKETKLAEEYINKTLTLTPKAHILKTTLLLKRKDCLKAQKEIDFLKEIKIESFEKEVNDLTRIYQALCLKRKNNHIQTLDINKHQKKNNIIKNYVKALQEIKKKKYNDAKKRLILIAKEIPNFSPAWIALGNLYLKQQIYDKAAFAYRNALNYQEKNPILWNNLAWSLLMQSIEQEKIPDQETLDAAEKAYSLDPENPVIIDTLALTYYYAGMKELACRTIQKAYKIGSEDKLIKEHFRTICF